MLYGGTLADDKGVNDTWAWNGSTWLRLDSGGASGPPPGQVAQMTWDVATGDMVLVTNGETMDTAETWTWVDDFDLDGADDRKAACANATVRFASPP